MPNFNYSERASTGLALIRAYNRWHRQVKQVLKPLALTHPQFLVLSATAHLASCPQPVTQRAIADQSDIDVMTLSTILTTLARRQLVIRQDNPTDARAKIVTLTSRAIDLLRTAVPTVEAVDAQFFACLGDQQAQLTSLLRQLTTNSRQGKD